AAGLLSLAGTFCYSEVAALMPEAGGDYVYLRRAYGRIAGFLFGWIAFAVFRTGSQAPLGRRLAVFMNVALGGALENWHIGGEIAGLPLHVGGLTVATLGTIWTVTLINCATVSAGGRTALVVTIAKIALVLAVGIGAFVFAPGEIRDPQRNLPRAFVGGTLLVALLYLFVNAAYYYVLSPLEIASIPATSSVATEVLKRFL